MTLKDAFEKCKERGLTYSYMHIYRIGLKVGFIIKNKPHNIFIEEKFNEWISTADIPEDCMFIKDAVAKYNITYQVFKYHLKKMNSEILNGGIVGYGQKYARKSDIEQIVSIYNKHVAERRNKKNG